MKTLVVGMLLSTVAVHVAHAKGPDLDALAKKSCIVEIERYDAEMAPHKAVLSQVAAVNRKTKEDYVYPTVRRAVQDFKNHLARIEAQLSAETLNTALEYNEAEQALDQSTKYSRDVKQAIGFELMRSHGKNLTALIKRDLSTILGNGSQNGNAVGFGSFGEGTTWSVYYAPAGKTPAGTIKYNVYLSNTNQVGRDELRMASVRVEFRYNPFTKEITGMPKSLSPDDIDAMFEEGRKTNGDYQIGLFLWSDNKVENAKKQVKFYEEIASYKACKELVK